MIPNDKTTLELNVIKPPSIVETAVKAVELTNWSLLCFLA